MSGNELDDRIVGGAGNDTLDGGFGSDVLDGGAGHDWFDFTTTVSPYANVDTLKNFSVADDLIRIDDAAFIGGGVSPGVLAASRFVIAAAAMDASDRIIYNAGTGGLFYDADGNGAATQVQFAIVGIGLAMTASNVVVI